MAAGSIVISLLMSTGSFETDTKRAEKRLSELRKEAAASAKVIGAMAVTVGAAAFTSFIANTIAAQNEQAQLAAVLRSTGEAAGWSAEQLNEMATSMSRASTFSAGEITKAQTRLLSYTGIVGEQFPKAMQSVIDMAARMGMSLEQSAETIGRALDIPSQGLTALTRQGFRFTDAQKELVKQLEETGRVAEAQAIVLSALESSYGGAALAARNTFGGSMQALKNEINNLMTGDGGSLDGMHNAIEGIINVLQGSETKAAFGNFTNLLAGLATTAATVAVTIGTTFTLAGRSMGATIAASAALLSGNFSQALDILKMRFGDARDEIVGMMDSINKLWTSRAPGGDGTAGGVGAAIAAPLVQAAKQAKVAQASYSEAARDMAIAQRALLEEGISLTQSLRTPLEILNDEYARLEKLVNAGAISHETLERALTNAQSAYDETLESTKKYREEQERLNALLAATPTAQLEKLRDDMRLLGRAFEEGTISAEQFNEAANAALGRTAESAEAATDRMSEFANQAARNMQDAFADFLFDPFSKGLDGMIDGFTKTINRMVADLLASQLLDFLKDTAKGGGFGSFIGGMFGGAKASGGDVIAGRSYLVGEHGPEMFTPRTTGAIIPASKLSGGGSVSVYNNFTVSGTTDRRSQQQIATDVGLAVERAIRRNG